MCNIIERLGAAGLTFTGRVVIAHREPSMVPEQHRVLVGVPGGGELTNQELLLVAVLPAVVLVATRCQVPSWSLRPNRV